MQQIIEERARKAWCAAWQAPRWGFQHHGDGPTVLLTPEASAAVEAGASRVPLEDGIVGEISVDRATLQVDGNTHALARARAVPTDIEVAEGLRSAHLDVARFLSEIEVATGISPSRVHVHIGAAGAVEATVAPSDAWVDPLIRKCGPDGGCGQQFIGKYKIGRVATGAMARLFGYGGYRQHDNGTPEALAPFVAPVRVVLDERWVVDARYDHTVSELLDALPRRPIYLHGVQLQRCHLALWTLSPVSHGTIHVYRTPAARVVSRRILGGHVVLPPTYRPSDFVPCSASFTSNTFAPEQRHTPQEMAAAAPAQPTPAFVRMLTLGEPVTISRAHCIFYRMSSVYEPRALQQVLLAEALPGQAEAMMQVLYSQRAPAVHVAFDNWIAQITAHIHATRR